MLLTLFSSLLTRCVVYQLRHLFLRSTNSFEIRIEHRYNVDITFIFNLLYLFSLITSVPGFAKLKVVVLVQQARCLFLLLHWNLR